ncbi:HAMP domain-containing histidine kinase [Clostridium sp. SHJSY1]|uniref:HAMP domain-containing sensor histidine kinase n=1 Tax=Clostridium sp. SHJSY1 TaxID=2942483 RepID=UPI002875C29E|nr:HAMP domain-containing sensor histidine kinase [Clostridium sp. SHJSY1]MDS0525309.1 HAMP domain-containing histidine kinase [Clostridium sp. SHJSY1]
MKRNSLISKLIAVLMVVLSIGLILLGTVLNSWFKNYYFDFRRTELDNQSYPILSRASSYLTLKDDKNLSDLQNTVSIINDSIKGEIYIVVDNGDVLTRSSNEDIKKDKLNLNISEDNMGLIKDGKVLYFKDNGEVYRYIRPIFTNGYFSGTVIVDTLASNIDPVLEKAKKIIWTFIFITIVSTATIVGAFTRRFVVNPINEINRIANKLARGEVENRVRVKNFDEIGELARSFNVMAEYLERVDANRRDFISNVSHELRSPITSIKGFIAGILDGIIPRDKENYYLNIVYDEINRLSRLVNDLLDISAMDDGKYSLNMVEVDIDVLIKLCVVNAEAKSNKKRLNFQVSLDDSYSIVYADRDRIMQVVTNLLDNAIKYSYDGGNVRISTKDKGNKIYVKIRNEGPILTKEELVKIWDRFYKADKSRTNKESTGLGLSIVRLILTQHGEDIWVKNEKDGVSFTFTLLKKDS